jgi:hypothetical protein
MSLSTGQDNRYEELDGLSHPPVHVITAPQREHVIIDPSDRDKAERTKCLLEIHGKLSWSAYAGSRWEGDR